MSHIDDGRLNALLDGELDAVDVATVQAHIAACPECARRFEEAKRFLAESADLLGALEPPAAAAPAQASRRVSRTAKEAALDVDEATQQSPAIRPVAVEPLLRRPPRPKPERRFDPTSLAWAAIIVLAIGVGYLANEVRHARETQGPATAIVPTAAAQRAAGQVDSNAGGAATTARARDVAAQPPAGSVGRRGSQGPPAAKAPPGEGEPPVAGRTSTGLGHKRLQPPGRAAANLALQAPAQPTKALDAASAPGAAGGVAAAAPAPAAAPAAERNAPQDRRARPVAEGGADSVLTVVPREPEATGAHAQEEARRGAAPGTAFRTATLEEAVASLGGTIRLVDGLDIERVQIGPGRLVAGADSAGEVVRVTYTEAGRALLLDQQRVEAVAGAPAGERAARAADELGPGDTVLTVAPDGWGRARWLDRGGLWLSLSGRVPADTLRALAERVR